MWPDGLAGSAADGREVEDFPQLPPALGRCYTRWGKRALDLSLGVPVLLAISPFMMLLAAVIRLLLGHPVLFRQQRPGLRGGLFTLFKFRTMTDDRDRRGNLLSDAQRLTPFGRFLRSTSLDELPEFWNVLRGDMSLVGPRPLLTQYLDRYTPEQARRHDVRPGITGWSQVNGRNAATWSQRLRDDVWYVDHLSFWLDARVLVLTVWRVLNRQDISAPGHSTMPGFSGIEVTSPENSNTSSPPKGQSNRVQS